MSVSPIDLNATYLKNYPELQDISDHAWYEALGNMQHVEIPKGACIYRTGDICQNFTLLLEGSVKVFVRGKNGREIVLYHIQPGEMCILSLAGLLKKKPYQVEATAATSIRALTLNREQFREVYNNSLTFREYIINLLIDRLDNTMMLIQEVAFERLDTRMADFLCRMFKQNDMQPIQITHQQLAIELGTTREVTSRMLKTFEKCGCIQLGRGQIKLLNEHKLRQHEA